MLGTLRRAGGRFVATRSSNARALPAAELADLARARFEHVEAVDDPVAAVARAHALGEPVLVTGLALPPRRPRPGRVACAMARRVGASRGARVRRAHRRRDHRARVRRRLHDRQASAMTLAVSAAAASLLRESETGTLSRNLGIVLRRRVLARDGVLDVQGRAAPDRGSVARRAGDPGRSLPAVPRPDHLHVLPPARVHRGRARARARDQGDGGAARAARPRCPVCRGEVEQSYLVCPVCTTRLRPACAHCGQPLEALWQVCPYCATAVPPGLPSRRGPARSRARDAAARRLSGVRPVRAIGARTDSTAQR